MDGFIGMMAFSTIVYVYFLPTVILFYEFQDSDAEIENMVLWQRFLLDLFLNWTILAWFLALYKAVRLCERGYEGNRAKHEKTEDKSTPESVVPKEVSHRKLPEMPVDKYKDRESLGTKSTTIQGETVRSISEKIIADCLYEYSITYEYESPLLLIVEGEEKIVYPDFYLSKCGVYMEFLGMAGRRDYDKITSWKKKWYKRNNIPVIYLHKRDVWFMGKYPLRSKKIYQKIDSMLLEFGV